MQTKIPTPTIAWKILEMTGIGVCLWPKFLCSRYCWKRTCAWTPSRHLKTTGASSGTRFEGLTIDRLAKTPHNLTDDIETGKKGIEMHEYKWVTVMKAVWTAVITNELSISYYVLINIHCEYNAVLFLESKINRNAKPKQKVFFHDSCLYSP